MPTFGARVVGAKEHDKALREEKGGGNVFGVRVRGAIPEQGPISIAKRNTEHGVRVLDDVQNQDEKGKAADGVSIESLRNILAENPTFFDSLYEAELAREDGARREALEIFQVVESGIKGAGRREILDEIAYLLGTKKQQAEANADEALVRREQIRRMVRRQEENVGLVDADRIEAINERRKLLDDVSDEDRDQLGAGAGSANVERQLDAIAESQGIDRNTSGDAKVPSTPAKPDGPVHVESQQPGERLGVPKATSEGSVDETNRRTDNTGTSGEAGTEGEGEKSFDEMTVADLEAHLGEEAVGKVKGTGAGGRVLKADLVKAAKKAEKAK